MQLTKISETLPYLANYRQVKNILINHFYVKLLLLLDRNDIS